MAMDGSVTEASKLIRLEDYRPPAWCADQIDLQFVLSEDSALVTATVAWTRNPLRIEGPYDLDLDGEALELVSLRIDHGLGLSPAAHALLDGRLIVHRPDPRPFTTRIVTKLRPQDNRTMEGLYRSGGMFCTQMEAQGFRRVTYFSDRPDVLGVWTVRVEADATRYPVLLSNGNLTESGPLEDGRHFVVWHDPHPKPSYLFALVAGDLDVTDDEFVTSAGSAVRLRLFTDKGNADQAPHALAALKKSMAWDESVYGRQYDLDIFHIVAVHDFNMGAMENKSLNIFNASAVLAKAETATDDRFARIEAIVAHEYFHNWSGNRVTCRDWFQLSLKEGFTVFRDQEFSADVGDRGVARINQVRHLRQTQFNEDAGPMAHQVRPDAYIEINNFYTTTIYEKGAELIRMMATLLGSAAFRAGTDVYFARHDGEAVTCEDFVRALEDASGVDLDAFRRWYSQAGTPHLRARGTYDAAARTYDLELTQMTPPTPGQPDKEPVVIPVRMGLLDDKGCSIPLRMEGEQLPDSGERILVLQSEREVFRFLDVPHAPVPSLLRGFSAPVKLDDDNDAAALRILVAHEHDSFVRWDAFQRLATAEIVRLVHGIVDDGQPSSALRADPAFVATFAALICDQRSPPAFRAEVARLPDEATLGDAFEIVPIDAIHAARQALRVALGTELAAELRALYTEQTAATADRPYAFNSDDAGSRALKNVALAYLVAAGDFALAQAQMTAADNMTDELSALALLADVNHPGRADALERFYQRWHHDALVMNAWFSVQASASTADIIGDIKRLAQHTSFDAGNPNKIRALYGAFAMTPIHLHAADGSGYRLLAELTLTVDRDNPILAGRLARFFNPWRRQDEGRRAFARDALEMMAATPSLSPNTAEVVSKLLA
jgi:aminopeptidase N